MKIAMIGWEYPPQFSGGLGVHCQAITHALTEMGISLNFYLPAYQKTGFHIPKGMNLHLVEMNETASAYSRDASWDAVKRFRAKLEEVFKPEGINIIHAHDWMGVFAATPIAQRYKIPLVWTVHSTEYDRAAGMSLHSGIFSIEKEAFSKATHTIAVSQYTKQTLTQLYQADPNKVTVIYNGINTTPFEQMSKRDYQTLDGHILFLGRVTGQKGPEHFLEAARLVLAEKDVRFMIAGKGDMLGILRHRARRWKIDDRVQFTGSVIGDQWLDCYRNALLFVLPAVSEPFGITVLEAMAAGIPTIISTSTGAGEIVKNTLLVAPNNPKKLAETILTLLNNTQLRQTLGQEGNREVRQWTWKRVAQETHSLYLQLLGKETS